MLSKTKAIKEAYAKLFHQSFCSRSFFEPLIYASETPINAGVRVRVALGSREIIGITEGKTEKPETLKIIKPILSIIDEHSIISEEQQALVQFASDYYKAPLGDFLLSSLPAPIRKGKTIAQSKDRIGTRTTLRSSNNQRAIQGHPIR